MKKEDALALSEQAVSELAVALAAGKSDKLKHYLKMMGSFHSYSFCNCMLIAKQFPTATMVAGFNAWKKRGRGVKKGEKGICILAPLIRKKEEEQKEKEVFAFRAVHVFDVSQTEGEELPEFTRVTGDADQWLVKLHAVASQRSVELCYKDDLGGAEGYSKGGSICLLSGQPSAVEFSVLAHELAHEQLHHGPDRDEFPKVVRELEAEAVAFVVATACGLENALEQSADYIQLYSGSKDLLLKSLGRIQRTASKLIWDMDTVELSAVH